MGSVPAKVQSRISTALKRFQPVLQAAHKRDVNESDTVTILADMLCDMMGYDKYSEVTSEYSIRSTYCDLAIKVDGHLAVLIEVKAVGLDLKDNHVKQAVDYAANEGCEWVCLSNGVIWQVYKVSFSKPIQHELVLEVNLLELSHRKDADIERIYLLSREGWQKSRLDDYALQQQATSRFAIAAVLLGDPVLQVVRRELRRISPDVKIETEEIERVIRQDVIKREIIEGDRAEAARKLVTKASKRSLRVVNKEAIEPIAKPDHP